MEVYFVICVLGLLCSLGFVWMIVNTVRQLAATDLGDAEEARRYQPIEDLLAKIEGPNGPACVQILADNRKLFETVQGSTNNHQAWPGGYVDHVTDGMNVVVQLYGSLNACRPLPFTLSDALLIFYLHDVEKPWKYDLGEDGQLHHKPQFASKEDAHVFRAAKLEQYGITLTDEQLNALKYVEGELNDYSSRRRVMGPLAAFCHLADVTSARIWFDCPMGEADPWAGAGRVRTS